MEQSTLSDSTRMSAAQVEMRDPGTERAVTALLAAPAGITPPPPAADPIFAVIAESRRLFDAWTEAGALPPNGIDPAPEARAAGDAFHAHCENVLLRTVPQTAAGCAALARYAHDFTVREGWTLDQQDEDATDHLRILDLIARSPMRQGELPASGQPVPSQDAELLDLGHRFEIAAGNELVSCANANAAEAEARPDPRRIAEAEAAANDAGDIAADLAHRIAGIPAHTAHGLRLKIRALIHYNAAAFADPPDMSDPDQALAHSLRIDATRLGLGGRIAKPEVDLIERDTGRPDLSKLSIVQLHNLYERYVQISDVWNDALHAPWTNRADGAGFRASNAAGDLIKAEQIRVCALYEAVVQEMEERTPSEGDLEPSWRLGTLIRHELMCNGDLRDAPALLSAIAQQWGAQA